MKFNDLTGKRFDKISVLSLNGVKNTKHYWNCICDCGKEFVREGGSIKTKSTVNKSCGCYSKNRLSQMRKKHMMSETRFYNIYCKMKARTTNQNDNKYELYGGRGIKTSESWLNDFMEFKNDMYESYLNHAAIHGEKNTTLERIDVNGNYDKTNCKWATIQEQENNKQIHVRKFKGINIATGEEIIGNNKSKTADKLGIDSKHISSVLNGKRKSTHGYTFEYID